MKFTEEALTVLMNPWDWKIVSSAFPADIPTAVNSRYSKWLEHNNHSHYVREILICLSGKSFQSLNSKVYPCSPGAIFFFNSGESHDNYYQPDLKNISHLWLGFLQDKLYSSIYTIDEKYAKRSRFTRTFLPCSESATLLASVWTDAVKNKNNYSYQHIRLKLISALSSCLLSIIELPENDKNIDSMQSPAERIAMIKAHIKDSIGKDDVSLDKMAALAGYSKFHFTRIFRDSAGVSFHQYVDRCRVKKVAELEKHGFTMKEISFKLNFSSPAAFSRWHTQNIKGSYKPK